MESCGKCGAPGPPAPPAPGLWRRSTWRRRHCADLAQLEALPHGQRHQPLAPSARRSQAGPEHPCSFFREEYVALHEAVLRVATEACAMSVSP